MSKEQEFLQVPANAVEHDTTKVHRLPWDGTNTQHYTYVVMGLKVLLEEYQYAVQNNTDSNHPTNTITHVTLANLLNSTFDYGTGLNIVPTYRYITDDSVKFLRTAGGINTLLHRMFAAAVGKMYRADFNTSSALAQLETYRTWMQLAGFQLSHEGRLSLTTEEVTVIVGHDKGTRHLRDNPLTIMLVPFIGELIEPDVVHVGQKYRPGYAGFSIIANAVEILGVDTLVSRFIAYLLHTGKRPVQETTVRTYINYKPSNNNIRYPSEAFVAFCEKIIEENPVY